MNSAEKIEPNAKKLKLNDQQFSIKFEPGKWLIHASLPGKNSTNNSSLIFINLYILS